MYLISLRFVPLLVTLFFEETQFPHKSQVMHSTENPLLYPLFVITLKVEVYE